MGLRINTNVQSLRAQQSLGKVTREQEDSLAKMSSGTRINKAADDAAGLAISERLKAEIRGTQQAERNANDGVSMIQVAEGGLTEISNIMTRLRELSVQAASDTVGEVERSFTDKEYQNLVSEVSRIAESTEFNGKSLLNGEGEKLEWQVGTNNNAEVDRIAFNPGDIAARADQLEVEGTNVLTKVDAQENLAKIDSAINKINEGRAGLGAMQNRLQSTMNNLSIKTENLSAANSRIRDTDVASESAKLARANILTAASSSVLAQANSSGNQALKLIG